MKYKLRKKIYNNIIIVGVFVIALIFAFSSSFYLQKMSEDAEINVSKVIKTKKEKVKSPLIKEYVESFQDDSLIEEIDFKDEITSVLTIEESKYQSKIFDYETGEELTINDLINKDSKTLFWQKIEELLYLKYPNFIADVLKTDQGEKVYNLKENELIIYFYDYEIEPTPNEELFLRVNYNEIKEYLDITVNLDSSYQNEDGNIINPNKKLIALTFDDGPGPYTMDVVNILISNKAKATFFMLGSNLEKYRSSVLAVYNSGFEIGYHSYAHVNFKRQELEEIKNEFAISNEILKSITGITFSLIRPPYGSINDDIKEILDTPIILWHIDTEDWRYKDPEYLTNYVLENAHDGDIILFHDIHKTSVATIEMLLPLLYVNGYQVLTVSELANAFNIPLENHKAYRYFTR